MSPQSFCGVGAASDAGGAPGLGEEHAEASKMRLNNPADTAMVFLLDILVRPRSIGYSLP